MVSDYLTDQPIANRTPCNFRVWKNLWIICFIFLNTLLSLTVQTLRFTRFACLIPLYNLKLLYSRNVRLTIMIRTLEVLIRFVRFGVPVVRPYCFEYTEGDDAAECTGWSFIVSSFKKISCSKYSPNPILHETIKQTVNPKSQLGLNSNPPLTLKPSYP